MNRRVVRNDARREIRGPEKHGRHTEDEPLRIAEDEVDDDRQRDCNDVGQREIAAKRDEMRSRGAERQRRADDEDETVELHAGVAASDERKKQHEAGSEIDEEERE